MIDFIYGIRHSHNEQIQMDLFLVSLKHWALAQSAQCKTVSSRTFAFPENTAECNILCKQMPVWRVFLPLWCLWQVETNEGNKRKAVLPQESKKAVLKVRSSRTEGCLNWWMKKKLVNFWGSSSRSMAWWVLKGMAWWVLCPGYAIEVSTPSRLLPVASELLAFWGRAQILVWKKTKLLCGQRNSQPSSERQTSVQKQK